MNNKRKAIGLVVCLFILVAIVLVYIFSELYTEKDFYENKRKAEEISDALKFKEEYEKLNDKETGDGHKFRNITISENNPFIYKNIKDVLNGLNKKETFIVYFGFSSCPWCRSVLPSIIDAANESDIETIFYVDIKDVRDEYSLDEKNKPVKTKEGTKEYMELIEKIDSILPVYNPLFYENSKGKKVSVKVDEKRIYAPTIILIVNGSPIAITDGISDLQEDPYINLTKEMQDGMKEEIKDVFNKYNQERYSTTSCNEFMC